MGPESFARGGLTLKTEKRGVGKTTISRPSFKSFHLRADDGPTWNAGLVALGFFRGSGPVLLRNPIFL